MSRFGFNVLRRREFAFTLVEILVACTVAMLLMVVVLGVLSTTSRLWKDTSVKIQAFGDARAAFSRISQDLSQALLNSYWDYDTLPFPTKYERYSELQFLTCRMSQLSEAYTPAYYPTCGAFFQAPTGVTWAKNAYGNMPGLLNAYGYFIEFGSDQPDLPSFLPSTVPRRYRFRLKQWQMAAEDFKLYSQTATANGKKFLGADTLHWIKFTEPVPRTIAENVIALLVVPRAAEANGTVGEPMTANYFYNSRNDGASTLELAQKHQLPPTVEVVLVTMDETSARRVQGNSTTPPALVAPSLFTDPRELERDIQTLLTGLDDQKIRYVVLRSIVSIRGAQWN